MIEPLREVELDELEAYLSFYKALYSVDDLTCDQIANKLSERYQIKCSGEEIFLLHEPDVLDVWYDSAYYYSKVLGINV